MGMGMGMGIMDIMDIMRLKKKGEFECENQSVGENRDGVFPAGLLH